MKRKRSSGSQLTSGLACYGKYMTEQILRQKSFPELRSFHRELLGRKASPRSTKESLIEKLIPAVMNSFSSCTLDPAALDGNVANLSRDDLLQGINRLGGFPLDSSDESLRDYLRSLQRTKAAFIAPRHDINIYVHTVSDQATTRAPPSEMVHGSEEPSSEISPRKHIPPPPPPLPPPSSEPWTGRKPKKPLTPEETRQKALQESRGMLLEELKKKLGQKKIAVFYGGGRRTRTKLKRSKTKRRY